MVSQPWCDVTPEAVEKAREAGASFGCRRRSMPKELFIKEAMDAEASLLRMRVLMGDAIGNA